MEGGKESKSQETPSSYKNNNEQKRKGEVENGKDDKKLKMELVTESEEEFDVNETSINNLPPEMLMKILKNLDTQNLSACRLVNKNWNEIVIEIMKLRANIQIKIDCLEKRKSFKSEGGKEKNLRNFIKCFGPSKNFPFSRFFCQVDNSTFESNDWITFVSDFGENIKGLNLKTNPISKDKDLLKLTNNLNNLLLNQLPNLQEFGINLNECKTKNSSKIQLFPNPTAKNPDKSKEETIAAAVQLPHLKKLYVDEDSLSNYTGIIVDLLLAAVNLEKLDCFLESGLCLSLSNLYLLQSLGKLHCAQNIELELAADFFSKQAKSKSQAPLVFQMKVLDLYMTPVYEDQSIRSISASFLSNLFETSKDTLRRLDTEAFGFLDELKLPKFSHLSKMTICGNEEDWVVLERCVPSGIKLQNTFPVLNSLELQIPFATAFPPEDYASNIPALETLKVTKNGLNNNSIVRISAVCPNLKHLEILNCNGEGSLENFPEVGTAVWTHLKKLQSLKLEIEGSISFSTFPAIDSCITGFSKEDCERIYDLTQAEKLLNKWSLQGRISQSEMEAERKNVSILDLKDLKKLTIGLVWFYEAGNDDEPSEDLTKKALTFISEDYALKLMDNLNYEINRRIERV